MTAYVKNARYGLVAGDARPPIRELARASGPLSLVWLAALAVSGAWLIASPWLLGHAGHAMAISDIASGALLIVVAVLAMWRRYWLAWVGGAIGLWLVLSPIALWAPTAASYVNATTLGTIAMFAGFVLPVTRSLDGDSIPAGWSYNPSSWGQRVPVIVLAIASYAFAVYMTAFQLGYIDQIVDPVFGDGTRRVLTSSVSQSFPVSDAGLGAAMYLVDLVMTCAGDRRRWRTMPWLVIVFGILIIPVGVVSIILVMLQPIAVGAWCAWCLLTAIATLAMIPLAIDEVAATIQLLRRVHAEGGSWTYVLWRGCDAGAVQGAEPPRMRPRSVPWSLAFVAGAGVWSMVEPDALGTGGALATSTIITGALAIVVAGVAASEIARPVRLAALPIGAWTILAPWVLSGATPTSHLAGALAGFIMLAAGLARGPVRQRRAELDRIAYWPAVPAAT